MNTLKLWERFCFGDNLSPMSRAPIPFWNPGIPFLTILDGLSIWSGSCWTACFPRERRLLSPYALDRAARSPKYQASSSWQTIRIMTSSCPVPLHRSLNCCLRVTQLPPSLSRTITKRIPGSCQARSMRGMFRSRSCLPSCGIQRKCWPGSRPGNNRGRSPLSIACIERSSSRKTTRPTTAIPLPIAPASRADPVGRPHWPDQAGLRCLLA